MTEAHTPPSPLSSPRTVICGLRFGRGLIGRREGSDELLEPLDVPSLSESELEDVSESSEEEEEEELESESELEPISASDPGEDCEPGCRRCSKTPSPRFWRRWN